MKYTKKPVTIEAFLWTGKIQQTVPSWIDEAVTNGIVTWNITNPDTLLTIKTLEGIMEALPGDYVIRGIKGEIYPCKPDIFAASYIEGTSLTIGISDETALNELTKLQSTFGYKTGEVDIIALLGLFGEAGEVLDETHTTDFNFEDDRRTAITWAKILDRFKKKIRNNEAPKLHVHIDNPKNFDLELADCFYYLNVLATNRGLTLNQLAQMSLDKIKAKKEKALG